MAKTIGGVRGVLGDLLSNEPEAGTSPPAPKSAKRPAEKEKHDSSQRIEESQEPAPEAKRLSSRRGRPLGRKPGTTPLKEKTSVWLSASLIARYREWSWEERCNLGELVERALVEYQRRNDRPAKSDGSNR